MEDSFNLTSESEKLYQNLFEKNPSCMYIFDQETLKILDANETVLKTYGYSREEFLSMTIKDFRPPEDLPRIKTAVANLLDDFKIGIWRHTKKNGEVIIVEIRAVKMIYKGRKAILSIPQDITERVKKEDEINKLNTSLLELNESLRKNITDSSKLNEELKLNEARLKAAQEAGKIGYWESNLRKELYYCSEELYKIFDLPVHIGAVKKDLFTPRILPQDLFIVRNAFERARLYGEPLDYSYRIFGKNGEVKYIYTKAELKLGSDGLPEMVVGISMDVTEREKDRQKLIQHSNNINIILRSITDIFYIVDKEYSLLFANEAVEKLTGLKHDELTGKNIWEIFSDADLSLPKKEFRKALKENKASQFQMVYYDRTFQVYLYPSDIGLAVSGKDVTDHMKTQQELSQQINNINIILSSITDPFFIIDKLYNFVFVNEAVEKLTGYKKEELVGKKVWMIYQHLDFTTSRRAFETAFKKNATSEFEFDYKGRIFYAHVYPSEIGLAVSCADITSKKEIDNELKETIRFIREVSNNTPGVIYQSVFYPDGTRRITFASEYYEEFTGTPVEEVLKDSEKLFEAVHPEDSEKLRNALDESNVSRTKLDIKYRMINKKTNKVKWVRSNSIPRKMLDGTTVVTGVVMDITESENYYTEMEKSNQRYEYISKASNETIWDMDVKTDTVTLGGSYKEMYGTSFPNNQCNAYDAEKFIHPDDLPRMLKRMAEIVLNRENYLEERYRLCRADGSIIYVYERDYIFYEEGTNNPIRILGTMQDVTALKLAEMEREKIISDLVKKNSALEQFTYMVSHNLRAPVANIIGLSSILEDEEMDIETKSSMNHLIVKASARLDEVINDMNEILSIQRNFNEDKTEIEFEALLYEVKTVLERAIADSKIKIISDFSNVKKLFTIKSSMQSIFQNLISNSIKFKKEEDAFVKITSSEDNEYIYLNFEDNGIGIDMNKNNEKIFVLYNRFHHDKEGKGVGLFMVKSQIESMNGEISIESEVNKGTKFFIKFKK